MRWVAVVLVLLIDVGAAREEVVVAKKRRVEVAEVRPLARRPEAPSRFASRQAIELGAALEETGSDLRGLTGELLDARHRGESPEQLWERVEREPEIDLKARVALRRWIFR
jgi:hypothetical protein